MISEETVQKAVELLKAAAAPSRIILFGSYAHGDARETSDLDFLVTMPVVTARRREMVRLSDVLRPLRLPADVLVVSDRVFDEWRNIPGTVLYEANREGRMMYVRA
jgi:uncharacterized protein